MRVDDSPVFRNYLRPQQQPFGRFDQPPSWISSEEERRLSLIRNHRRQGTALGFDGGPLEQHRHVGIDSDFQVPAARPASRNGPPLPVEPMPSHYYFPADAKLYDGYREGLAFQNSDKIAPQRRDFGRVECDAVDNLRRKKEGSLRGVNFKLMMHSNLRKVKIFGGGSLVVVTGSYPWNAGMSREGSSILLTDSHLKREWGSRELMLLAGDALDLGA